MKTTGSVQPHNQQIPSARLLNQGITTEPFASVSQVVNHLGAVQAQDYYGGLWSIGMRIPGSVEADIEKAIYDRKIVRTWPMRGTIHFVPAEDARWMVNLLAGRVNKRMASYFRKAELTEEIFGKCADILIKHLEGGKVLSRKQIYDLWENIGVPTKNTRGLFIIDYLAQTGLICFGPRQGKQPTFTLLDEWVTSSRDLIGSEAIAELALRYFTSHGPAQVKDLMWWSGLTLKEVNTGLELVKSKLISEKVEDKVYWTVAARFKIEQPKPETPIAYLLQAYDEYTVAYKDRSAIFNMENEQKVKNGMNFTAIFILDGEVMGFWKRTLKKDRVEIEIDSFKKLNRAEMDALNLAAEEYGRFLGFKVELFNPRK